MPLSPSPQPEQTHPTSPQLDQAELLKPVLDLSEGQFAELRYLIEEKRYNEANQLLDASSYFNDNTQEFDRLILHSCETDEARITLKYYLYKIDLDIASGRCSEKFSLFQTSENPPNLIIPLQEDVSQYGYRNSFLKHSANITDPKHYKRFISQLPTYIEANIDTPSKIAERCHKLIEEQLIGPNRNNLAKLLEINQLVNSTITSHSQIKSPQVRKLLSDCLHPVSISLGAFNVITKNNLSENVQSYIDLNLTTQDISDWLQFATTRLSFDLAQNQHNTYPVQTNALTAAKALETPNAINQAIEDAKNNAATVSEEIETSLQLSHPLALAIKSIQQSPTKFKNSTYSKILLNKTPYIYQAWLRDWQRLAKKSKTNYSTEAIAVDKPETNKLEDPFNLGKRTLKAIFDAITQPTRLISDPKAKTLFDRQEKESTILKTSTNQLQSIDSRGTTPSLSARLTYVGQTQLTRLEAYSLIAQSSDNDLPHSLEINSHLYLYDIATDSTEKKDILRTFFLSLHEEGDNSPCLDSLVSRYNSEPDFKNILISLLNEHPEIFDYFLKQAGCENLSQVFALNLIKEAFFKKNIDKEKANQTLKSLFHTAADLTDYKSSIILFILLSGSELTEERQDFFINNLLQRQLFWENFGGFKSDTPPETSPIEASILRIFPPKKINQARKKLLSKTNNCSPAMQEAITNHELTTTPQEIDIKRKELTEQNFSPTKLLSPRGWNIPFSLPKDFKITIKSHPTKTESGCWRISFSHWQFTTPQTMESSQVNIDFDEHGPHFENIDLGPNADEIKTKLHHIAVLIAHKLLVRQKANTTESEPQSLTQTTQANSPSSTAQEINQLVVTTTSTEKPSTIDFRESFKKAAETHAQNVSRAFSKNLELVEFLVNGGDPTEIENFDEVIVFRKIAEVDSVPQYERLTKDEILTHIQNGTFSDENSELLVPTTPYIGKKAGIERRQPGRTKQNPNIWDIRARHSSEGSKQAHEGHKSWNTPQVSNLATNTDARLRIIEPITEEQWAELHGFWGVPGEVDQAKLTNERRLQKIAAEMKGVKPEHSEQFFQKIGTVIPTDKDQNPISIGLQFREAFLVSQLNTYIENLRDIKIEIIKLQHFTVRQYIQYRLEKAKNTRNQLNNQIESLEIRLQEIELTNKSQLNPDEIPQLEKERTDKEALLYKTKQLLEDQTEIEVLESLTQVSPFLTSFEQIQELTETYRAEITKAEHEINQEYQEFFATLNHNNPEKYAEELEELNQIDITQRQEKLLPLQEALTALEELQKTFKTYRQAQEQELLTLIGHHTQTIREAHNFVETYNDCCNNIKICQQYDPKTNELIQTWLEMYFPWEAEMLFSNPSVTKIKDLKWQGLQKTAQDFLNQPEFQPTQS